MLEGWVDVDRRSSATPMRECLSSDNLLLSGGSDYELHLSRFSAVDEEDLFDYLAIHPRWCLQSADSFISLAVLPELNRWKVL